MNISNMLRPLRGALGKLDRLCKAEPAEDSSGSTRPELAREITAGAAIIAVFFVGFLGWAALAPLESAAVASGLVSVEGNRKTIQHLEGGIVERIAVREGDKVDAGQLLIQLDNTMPGATLELLRGRWMVARALEARLTAERDGQAKIDFPDAMLSARSDPRVAKIMEGQANIFEARRENLAGQTAILRQRVGQYEEEIIGIEGQIAAEDAQLELLGDEIEGLRALYKKGFARKPRLLQMERRAAEIEGARNMHKAQITRAKRSIGETKLRMRDLKTSMLNEVVEKLRAAQAELYDLDERLRAAEDVLRRTEIRAPLAGVVVGLQVHTTGGVVAPGESLMYVVPSDDRLVIEAKVDPQDIDVVHRGLPAEIRFTAFNQRHRAPVQGTVTSVSADRLTDEQNGNDYYLARVQLADAQADTFDIAELQPGMQAEVMIVTGKRTAFDYLMEPVSRSLDRAFRED
jgi:HlyD family type I secretion membrane fusion protein